METKKIGLEGDFLFPNFRIPIFQQKKKRDPICTWACWQWAQEHGLEAVETCGEKNCQVS